jgi:hypothetical protein
MKSIIRQIITYFSFCSFLILCNINGSAQTSKEQRIDSCGIDQLSIYFQTPIEERPIYFSKYLKTGEISLVIPDLILLDIAVLGSFAKLDPFIFLDGSFLGWQLVDTLKLDSVVKAIEVNADFSSLGKDNCSDELMIFDSDPECFKLLRDYLSCSACKRVDFLSQNYNILVKENPWFLTLSINDLNALAALSLNGKINGKLNYKKWKKRLHCKE